MAKAERAKNKGDYSKAYKYLHKSESCGKVALGFATLGIQPMLNRYENGD